MSNPKKLILGNMPQQAVVVYKDNNGFYSDGRTRELQCGYEKVGLETLSLIRQEPFDCPGRVYEAGDIVPDIFPNSIELVKMRTGSEYTWITPASYETYLANCLQCCEPLPTLDSVTGFVATAGSTEVRLDWNAVANATNYIIERDTDINFSAPTEVFSGDAIEFDDLSFVLDTTYYYRIKAQATGYLDSEWVALSATPSLADLLQPGNLVATPGDSQAVLDWDDVVDADNYVVEQDTTSDFLAPAQIYSGAASTHTAITLVNGTTYYFRVKAEGAGFDDSPWAFVNATPSV